MKALPAEAERFLRHLDGALSAMPAAEREDVVAEIRSHLEDRAARGDVDLLGPFGRPEAYAATFLQERALVGALARGTSWELGRALLAGARRFGWWYVVLVLAVLHLYGAVFVVLAVLKPLFPGNVGAFVGTERFSIGAHFGPESAFAGTREVLGWWSVPIFFVVGVLLLWSANWTLRRLARWRLARLRSAA